MSFNADKLSLAARFAGCITGGAIGDAWGSAYEQNGMPAPAFTLTWWGQPQNTRQWQLTDDTQLTLATCEAMVQSVFGPETLAQQFLSYYRSNRLSGLGSAILKALRDLGAGAHWSQAGRSGEFAAGNGAAMRIAPLAFLPSIDRQLIRDVCTITHKNDEAYTAALAVVLAIRAAITGEWQGNNLLEILIPQLPDTRVRDRIIALNKIKDTADIATTATHGTGGFAADSVPFALFAAMKALQTGMNHMYESVIKAGGDTDTNASIAGQVAGAMMGIESIPKDLLKQLPEREHICTVIEQFSSILLK
ncbi:ADP-ribosylglycohydrolase family protein [Chitinophagaceae bacterium MMS25-I14]